MWREKGQKGIRLVKAWIVEHFISPSMRGYYEADIFINAVAGELRPVEIRSSRLLSLPDWRDDRIEQVRLKKREGVAPGEEILGDAEHPE